ncbi:YccF domain-containing protein [Gemmatimonas sp.]|jgi:uncharacterized membrane protein YccF (DUF307 family)|uniref:YccF domain-containing protein n=1 Tax=Gemmatimonas sp. TaxID=1962908 RepID=UPI0037C0426F
MTTLLNVLWCICGGFLSWVAWVISGVVLAIMHVCAGVALCLTIIGIPFGPAHFRLAGVSLAPLGKRVQYTA